MSHPTEVTLDTPLDMHLHLREGTMLETVAPLSAAPFAGAVIMPNLVPPVDSLARLQWYRGEIARAIGAHQFTPLMALFFRSYTEHELAEAKPHIIGIKLYPAGVTTNSAGGVANIDAARDTLAAMERLGIPLLVHGETHGFVLDREVEFLPIYDRLARDFPRLTIIMEHITTRQAADFLAEHPNVYATVTLHHLQITLNDMAGGLLNPHLFCKPIAKRPEDREALLELALQAHPKLMFGSDSAPHPTEAKECAGCAAGVFSAPVALPMLIELFAQHGALARLQAFVSDNARRIYGINPPQKLVRFARQHWQVPARYGAVVPYCAGQQLGWQQQ
ncbi:dihydroorotase [Chloroflexia bacterium SDU3-3]|nr:dihydroorotase [Chloroflexia bacterium SDU3-3]